MARRNRFLRRRPRMRPHWAANMFLDTVVSTGLPDLVGNVVVDVFDYQGNTALSPQGVTLLRTVVNCNVGFGVDGVFGSDRGAISIQYGLLLQDPDDLVIPDPGSSTDLKQERWLHVGMRSLAVGHGASPATEVWPTCDIHVDCTARAKMMNRQLLWVVKLITNITPAGTFTVWTRSQARALLMGAVT